MNVIRDTHRRRSLVGIMIRKTHLRGLLNPEPNTPKRDPSGHATALELHRRSSTNHATAIKEQGEIVDGKEMVKGVVDVFC